MGHRARSIAQGLAAYLFWLATILITAIVYLAGVGRVGAFRYVGF